MPGAYLIAGGVLLAIACGDEAESLGEPQDEAAGGRSGFGTGGASGDAGVNGGAGLDGEAGSGAGVHDGGAAGTHQGPGAGAGGAEPRECSVVAPTACANPELVYADVAPIFEQRCVACHSGAQGGPWSLATYSHVATWRDTILATLRTCTMPPLDSGLEIPAHESELILAWIRCGMKP